VAEQAIFFVDAGRQVGLGHMMRCLTLADNMAASGWHCTLVAPGEVEEMLPGIRARGHGVIGLAAGTDLLGPTGELRRQISDVAVLIVDSYRSTADWEAQQRDWAERIVVIDDLANRQHDCDVLVDQTPGRTPSNYNGLLPENCTILAGASFAMLRQLFLQQRRTQDFVRKKLGRIVINFGGSDPKGMTSKALSAAIQTGLKVDIDVVLGANSTVLADVLDIAENDGETNVQIHQFVDDMAALFAKADLAIGAGGSSLLEKSSLGLPSLVITTASNQDLVARNIAECGAAKVLGNHDDVDDGQLVTAILALAGSNGTLAAMSKAAANVCDGKGGLRVTAALLPSTATRRGDPVSLRSVCRDDEQIIYDWQTEPDARRFFRHPEAPSRESHALWFKRRLDHTDDITCIVLVGGQAAGLVRLDCMDQPGDEDAMEISIIIATAYRSTGVGGAVLQLIHKFGGMCRLVAEVNPENTTSIQAFQNAGFQRISEDRFETPGTSALRPQ
jgi:UDP-2,4-diacetamido-2,4,6-trideoxy-beta-L-altropyranose hydrolase